MEQYKKHLIHLHIIVFIYGFTAILGRLITLDAISLVWYRMLIAFVTLGLMLLGLKKRIVVSPKSLMVMVGIGFIVAFHWITFFHAIKISTISVALGCLASTTLFTSFLEPAIIRRRISVLEVITGIIIIIGLYVIFQFEPDHLLGIITALLSAFLAALFTVLNKALVKNHHPVTISFYEMGGGFLAISLFMCASGSFNASFPIPQENDLIYLLLLGIVCTSYAFMASVKVMKSLSAYTVVLTVNLEPVYGILMAFFMFGDTEKMSPGFYLGTFIVLSAVFLFPVMRKKFPTRG